ncbi:zinc finger protein 236-like [Physella acuta]|uniref:zinc finger protein 236-like n=1 Tax=Physella acuta TaxID=109671 RepID=UPI0027DAC903|nr:zinc finger protein 236-like [Physella acuta]
MDPEDEPGSAGQNQNLHDLQNYLSTFNKEIEPGDDVLSHMGVDTGDVGDLYNPTSGSHHLQEPGEGGVTSQFSSGFYSEQGILDTPLSDETTHQIQSLVGSTDTDIVNIKQEVGTIDLESVLTQNAGFGTAQSIRDIQSNPMAGSLIMTSLSDNLDPTGGKVIRIVSLDDDGHYLSLSDGAQMQILNQDLGMSSDALTASDSVLAMQGGDTGSASEGATQSSSILTSAGANGIMITGRNDSITTIANSSNGISDSTQLVALQSDSSQPQLVALPNGTALTTEALQMSGLLATDGTINSDLGFQTITILPSELNQGGDMNYVLIMSQSDGNKDGNNQLTTQLAQVLDFKQENQEFTEDFVEINGEVKRILRVVPKKYINNFGTQLTCDYCDYTSPKRYLLTRHMKSHSDERPHKCKECDRGFKTPASLMNHVNTHTGTRPHKCKTCEAAFTTSGELVRHIRYRHTFEKPHRCPNCDYASVELSKLKRHMRSHTGERPYKCSYCAYASPDTYKLKRHLRIHTGEKPYECDICHTRFTQSNSLKAHKLIHSGNKPVFKCSLCPTTCGRRTDLKIHINKLHAEGVPLECKKCGQVFSDRYSYKQHVRGHDIDKCFKCDECDFIANTERSFDAHAAIHSNGKKYECDTCHTSFNLSQTLDKHKVTCQLGEESELDSSRDKESDEHSVDKTSMYKSSLDRPTQENKLDSILSADGSSTTSAPLTSDTLHRNLLQDIKAGKLGDVPQVVIVHPDGSLEEISSKIPIGDKMNMDDIFSALTNNEKSSLAGKVNTDKGGNKDTEAAVKISRDDDSSDDDHFNDEDGTEEPVESLQCEASTQAELESDSDLDSADDSESEGSISTKAIIRKGNDVFSGGSQRNSLTEQGDISNTSIGHISAASTDSLLQPINTCTATTSDNTNIQPQYIVVKGYTCVNSETGQPTLVNVAVDRDALMKMLTSLGGSGEGGVQLLSGDMEALSLPLDGTHGSIITMTEEQLSDFAGMSGHSSAGDISGLVTSDFCSPMVDDSSKNSEIHLKYKDSLKEDAPLSEDTLSMGRSQHNIDTSLPNDLLSTHCVKKSKSSTSSKGSPSTLQANTDLLDSPGTFKVDQIPRSESFSDHLSDGLPDHGLEVFQDFSPSKPTHLLVKKASKSPVNKTVNVKRKSKSSLSLKEEISVKDEEKDVSGDTHEVDLEAQDEFSLSSDKQKKYYRKRPTSADQSLVVTGKRVRKALVKVSM